MRTRANLFGSCIKATLHHLLPHRNQRYLYKDTSSNHSDCTNLFARTPITMAILKNAMTLALTFAALAVLSSSAPMQRRMRRQEPAPATLLQNVSAGLDVLYKLSVSNLAELLKKLLGLIIRYLKALFNICKCQVSQYSSLS